MGKFSNIFGNKTDDGQSSGQGNPNAALPLRLLAIGYLVYLIYQMVQSYAAGGTDAPSGAGFWIGCCRSRCWILFLPIHFSACCLPLKTNG